MEELEPADNAIQQDKQADPAEEKLLEEVPAEEVTPPKKKIKYHSLFGWG